MKKIAYLSLFIISGLAACKKESASCTFTTSNITAPQAETDSVTRYLKANNITATLNPAGFYYTINTPGTGTQSPDICSYISVQYKGYTFANLLIDQTTGTNVAGFSLGDLIPGWQKSLPYLKAGGNISLYLPPSLAYGAQERRDNNNNVVIPANSYLKFTITLVGVQ